MPRADLTRSASPKKDLARLHGFAPRGSIVVPFFSVCYGFLLVEPDMLREKAKYSRVVRYSLLASKSAEHLNALP